MDCWFVIIAACPHVKFHRRHSGVSLCVKVIHPSTGITECSARLLGNSVPLTLHQRLMDCFRLKSETVFSHFTAGVFRERSGVFRERSSNLSYRSRIPWIIEWDSKLRCCAITGERMSHRQTELWNCVICRQETFILFMLSGRMVMCNLVCSLVLKLKYVISNWKCWN